MGRLRNTFAIALCVAVLVGISSSVLVKTSCGVIVGKVTNEAISYLGVPYAEPPVGLLRWRNPMKKRPWMGIWDATYMRPACPQAPCDIRVTYGFPCSNVMSENCLHLNIFAPKGSGPGSNKAVLLYIHGGFFHIGSGNEIHVHGETFARKGDVILVTINYRLGALGTLWTAPGGIRGNFGIKDQRMAMKWVYNNIYNFGGDPNRIIIFGFSAGAKSVGFHLVNRKADRYFHGAIIMSAPFGISTRSGHQVWSVGTSFSNNLKCSPLDSHCLRSKSTSEILKAQNSTSRDGMTFAQAFMPWAPFFDGDELPIDVQLGLRKGRIDNKPVIIGTTSDEQDRYTYQFNPQPINMSTYSVMVSRLLPAQTTSILQRYVPKNPYDTRPMYSKLTTHIGTACPSRRIALDLSENGPGNVWVYVFEHGLDFLCNTDVLPECHKSACHGNDLPYLFQALQRYGARFTPYEQMLSDYLTRFWTNFAKTGNPNGPGTLLTKWPIYSAGHGPLCRLYSHFRAPQPVVQRDFRGKICDLFDQNGFYT